MKALQLFVFLLVISGWAQADWGRDWVRLDASYEVPVSDELKEFAHFSINDFKARTRDGVDEFKYTLPLELTGTPTEVHFGEETEDQGVPQQCTVGQCQVRYDNLTLDEVVVTDYLKNQNYSQRELQGRMEVFSSFVRDPEGIIYFEEARSY